MTTENLRNTMATLDAMKQANVEMKRQYGKIDVDKIEVRWLRLSRKNSSRPSVYPEIGFIFSKFITTWRT